jgi:glycosyltransferase involved in cell wall biosynthesis
MRILWFTLTSSLYDQGKHAYQGGGWIESLENHVRACKNIELAVSFYHAKDSGRVIKNNNIYYPIKIEQNSRLRRSFKYLINKFDNYDHFFPKFIEVIEDFKPDVIQIFGTERIYASIQSHTDIPVVIHIQSILNAYQLAYYPPGFSKWSFLASKNYRFYNFRSNPAFGLQGLSNVAKKEGEYFKSAKYLLGRTTWDKKNSEILAPKAQYFHSDEVIRPMFYNVLKKDYMTKGKVKIISTISPTVYKGMDVILKVADLLKKNSDMPFEWKVAGINSNDRLLRTFEDNLGIDHKQRSIHCLGIVKADELAEHLVGSDLYIHPTYIDNSPNSVCEAQLIGLPVIACNVGGVSSLINHEETGFLVPSNGIFEIASLIIDFKKDPEQYFNAGKKARQVALARHDPGKIVDDLLKTYRVIKETHLKKRQH